MRRRYTVPIIGMEPAAKKALDLDGAIEATAQVLAEAETSQQYSFRIVHGARVLAEGRAAVMLQPGGDGNNMQRDLR